MNPNNPKRKTLLTALFAILFGGCLFGQVTTYNAGRDTSNLTDIREKLVQLALQNPEFEIVDRKIVLADYELRQAKGDWAEAIVPTLNLNELTLKKKDAKSDQIFFPLYNVSVAVPLNFFSKHKNAVRIARENMYIAEAQKNQKYREIRTAVLTKYEDYLMYKDQLELQTRLTQDAYVNFRQKEKDFKDNLVTLEDYSKAQSSWVDLENKRRALQRDFMVSKYEIQQMIGITIEEALGKK